MPVIARSIVRCEATRQSYKIARHCISRYDFTRNSKLETRNQKLRVKPGKTSRVSVADPNSQKKRLYAEQTAAFQVSIAASVNIP